MKNKLSDKILGNKPFAVVCFILALFGIMCVMHQIFSYNYVLKPLLDAAGPDDPLMSTNTISGVNYLAFFTVLSNLFVFAYLICYGLAILDFKNARKYAFNTTIQGCVTMYIFITGFVYVCILLPFCDMFPWEVPGLAFSNIIDIYEHMIMPTFIVVLFFFPINTQKIDSSFVGKALIFPISYTIFSIMRGAVGQDHWFAYPFLSPNELAPMLFDSPPSDAVKWIVFLVIIAVFVGIFVLVGYLLKFIRNKQINRLTKKGVISKIENVETLNLENDDELLQTIN